MTFRYAVSLVADGKQAKAEMQSVAREARDVTKAFDAISSKGRGAATALDAMGDEALQTAGGLDAVAAAGDRAAQGARGVTESHIVAAGSVGNLTAQFNDIGVMLAAGQNPLQLAIQQGTQIGQVFQQSGATGRDAFKMLLSGATAMLSPINLITIGSIAAGAAMYQWLSSSAEEAESVEDILERLGSSIDTVRDRATRSASEIRDEFGDISPEIARMLRDLNTIGLDQLISDAEAASDALAGLSPDAFGQNSRRMARTGRDATTMGLQRDFDALGAASGINESLAALERVQSTMRGVAAEPGQWTDAQREIYEQTVVVEEALRRASEAQRLSSQQASVEQQRLLDLEQEFVNAYLEKESRAQAILVSLREENEIRRLTLLYGADSIEVADAMFAAKRRALEADIEALGVTGDLTDEMRRSLETGLAFSRLDLASGVWDAANAASAVAANLASAVAQAGALRAAAASASRVSVQRAQNRLSTVGDPVARAGGEAVIDYREQLQDGGYGLISSGRADVLRSGEDAVRQAAENAEALSEEASAADAAYRKLQSTVGGSGSRGGGGGERDKAKKELERQREAVERLIESEQRQLDILRETDPVQKELLRNRETLAAATEAERAQIEEIIATRQREEQAIARTQERAEFFQQTSYDALRGLIRGGDEAASAIDRMAAALEDAAFQALLLGEGPLAGLLGGGSGGGLIGVIGSALGLEDVPKNADGGMQYARGDSRSDGGLSWISSGEFIVNARATSQNRALLEAINSGSLSIGSSLPAFAAGGAFGGGAAMPADGRPVIQLIDQTGRGVNVTAEEDTLPSGQRRTRFVLADAVGDALTMPGGRARRALGSAYGLKTTGPKR